MIVDAHHHLWDRRQPFQYGWLDAPEKASIAGCHLPADLKPILQANGIDQTVCVQTQHDLAENRWALSLAEQNRFIAGVVGWVDLTSPACEDQLQEFLEHPKFVGVRHVTQDEPDDDFIIRPDVLRGLEVLQKHWVPFDLLFYVKHLHHIETLATRLPELPMVLDHLGKPDVAGGGLEVWRPRIEAAAKFPNVFCKLSGLVTEADWQSWTPADLKPYIDIAIEAFSPARCMFGSDWPVCRLAGDYRSVKDALEEATAQLTSDERANIFGTTAAEFYGLDGSWMGQNDDE